MHTKFAITVYLNHHHNQVQPHLNLLISIDLKVRKLYTHQTMTNLEKFTWGLPITAEQQAKHRSQLHGIQIEITNKHIKQTAAHVCLALQALISLDNLKEISSLHGNALMVVKTHPDLLHQALHKIYFELLPKEQATEEFTEALNRLNRFFKNRDNTEKDSFFEVTMTHFMQGKKIFDDIAPNLQGYLPFPYQFNSLLGTLTVNLGKQSFVFNITSNKTSINYFSHHAINLPLGSHKKSEEAKKFITLRIFSFLIFKIYDEKYNDLITLSFENFCANSKFNQTASSTMPQYFNSKKILSENDELFNGIQMLDKEVRDWYAENHELRQSLKNYVVFSNAVTEKLDSLSIYYRLKIIQEKIYASKNQQAHIHRDESTQTEKESQLSVQHKSTQTVTATSTPVSTQTNEKEKPQQLSADIKADLYKYLPDTFKLFIFDDNQQELLIKIDNTMVLSIEYEHILCLQMQDEKNEHPEEMKQFIAFRILRFILNARYTEDPREWKHSFVDYCNNTVKDGYTFPKLYQHLKRYFELKIMLFAFVKDSKTYLLDSFHPFTEQLHRLENHIPTFKFYLRQDHVAIELLVRALQIQQQYPLKLDLSNHTQSSPYSGSKPFYTDGGANGFEPLSPTTATTTTSKGSHLLFGSF